MTKVRDKDARWVIANGSLMLTVALSSVALGFTISSRWFVIAVFLGFWALIYFAVGSAMRD